MAINQDGIEPGGKGEDIEDQMYNHQLILSQPWNANILL